VGPGCLVFWVVFFAGAGGAGPARAAAAWLLSFGGNGPPVTFLEGTVRIVLYGIILEY
jgi:hypothetical protein